jgi:multiple sugar transport system substrate-binding protein
MNSGDASLVLGALQGSPYQPWLWSALASPTAPDVFVLSYQRFPAYAARGVLEPLGPYLSASSVIRAADFYPAALDAFRTGEITGDGLGAIPLNASSLAVYYNTDRFAECGVPLPADGWSWEEFASAAAATTVRDGDGRIPVYGLAIEPRLTRSAAFVWGAGGELVDDPDRPTRLTLDAPATREGLRWFAALGPAGRAVTPTAAETRRLNDLARFCAGGAAMLVQTRRVVPALRETADLRWDVAPLPVGQVPANVLHSDGLCMLDGARDKEAAWAFIEFAAGPVGQAVLAETGRTVPSLPAVAESDSFLAGTPRALQLGTKRIGLPPANGRVFLDNIPLARRLPALATLSAVQGAFDNAFGRAFYVDADVERAAAQIVGETRGILGDRLTVPKYMFKEAETGAEE